MLCRRRGVAEPSVVRNGHQKFRAVDGKLPDQIGEDHFVTNRYAELERARRNDGAIVAGRRFGQQRHRSSAGAAFEIADPFDQFIEKKQY